MDRNVKPTSARQFNKAGNPLKQPHEYPKRTLFSVIGMTPQIVTESLYALAVKQIPAFVPTDIKIVTTALGAEQVRLNLLSDSPGWFKRFCDDYGHTSIRFSEDDIQVLKRPNGSILGDIREPEDNELMANTITEVIRNLTSDEDRAIHVSIAGGRKTMGYYAGYALSLFGREQDRLSHVLVEAPYESQKDFYYTTPYRKVIQPDIMPLDTAKGKISLAEIPFVSLRQGLPDDLLKGNATFSETVELAKKVLEPTSVVIDLKNKSLKCAGLKIKLLPIDFTFYALLAKRKKAGAPPIGRKDDSIISGFLSIYEIVIGSADSGLYERAEKTLSGVTDDFFDQRLAGIKKELSRFLGKANTERYFVSKIGNRPNTRYELAVDGNNIHMIEDKT